MLASFLKRNSILITFFVGYLFTTGLFLIQLDKAYYQKAKRELMREKFERLLETQIGDERLNRLHNLASLALRMERRQDLDLLRNLIQQVVSEENSVYRIAVEREPPETPDIDTSEPLGLTESQLNLGEEALLVDAPEVHRQREKMRRFNRFSNSLFLRDFSSLAALPVVDRIRGKLGRLLVYYTSPLDDPDIQELTRRYRWYAMFLVAVLTTLALLVARQLLVPLRSVTNSLESSTAENTRFIERPRSRLEALYNRMALGAVFARLQGQLREQITSRPQMTGWEVTRFVCQVFGGQIESLTVGCLELVTEGPGHMRATGQQVLAGQGREWLADTEALARTIEQAVPGDGGTAARFTAGADGHELRGVVELIAAPDPGGIRYAFFVATTDQGDEPVVSELTEILDQLVNLADSGLQTLSMRNRLLVQERGRANISLSRNLGHDLTNIIATSKLELLALERILGDGQPPPDERRRTILLESLTGLLSSVRFMQETVNLYRAYAYLQQPALEVHDANKLVNETLELFGLSTSARVDLRKDLGEAPPRCYVDPRLVKLALFNMFANALEAIRKQDPEQPPKGWILVSTRAAEDGGLLIAVEDSGTGILTREGERAKPHEIQKIFELGYTSYRVGGNEGEGLGLNWVRTIVRDLHGGTIRAENVEGGGARFLVTFPPVGQAAERAAANEGEGDQADGRVC